MAPNLFDGSLKIGKCVLQLITLFTSYLKFVLQVVSTYQEFHAPQRGEPCNPNYKGSESESNVANKNDSSLSSCIPDLNANEVTFFFIFLFSCFPFLRVFGGESVTFLFCRAALHPQKNGNLDIFIVSFFRFVSVITRNRFFSYKYVKNFVITKNSITEKHDPKLYVAFSGSFFISSDCKFTRKWVPYFVASCCKNILTRRYYTLHHPRVFCRRVLFSCVSVLLS